MTFKLLGKQREGETHLSTLIMEIYLLLWLNLANSLAVFAADVGIQRYCLGSLRPVPQHPYCGTLLHVLL